MAEHPVIQMVRTVTTSKFNSLVLEGRGPIVVEFMSYGCAHCRIIAPILEQAATMVEFKVQIFMLNIAVDPELAERYAIQGTPTFILFLDGQVIRRIEGLAPDLSTVLAAFTPPYEE